MSGVKQKSAPLSKPGYSVTVKSRLLPFVVDQLKFGEYEDANTILQRFIKLVEKKFDSIWYIGSDFLGDDLYERFMFHRGGFLEISLSGKIRAFFLQDKLQKFVHALRYALEHAGTKATVSQIMQTVKAKKTIINLDESLGAV